MSAEPSTLTSHLQIINKKSTDGPNRKNGNGSGKNSANHKGKFKSQNGRSGQKDAGNRSPHRGHSGAKGRKEAPAQTSLSTQDREKPLTGNLDPFELFCAYHLGIGPNKDYKPSNINEVANRFRADPGTIRQALKEAGMDSASLLDRDFDMAMAQLDIQVAPEGVDRTELARSIYADYLDAPYQKRDWKKMLEEDRMENRKIFG